MKRPGRGEEYTFKYNRGLGRHGWLRLTPAYSVKLVHDLMHGLDLPPEAFLLDPFSGTATTGLVAAEKGLRARLFEINPFLVWLGNVKCANYSPESLNQTRIGVEESIKAYRDLLHEENWIPRMRNISRWWSATTLMNLAALKRALEHHFGAPGTGYGGLAWVGFCRLVIETSAAAFNHISLSFYDRTAEYETEYLDNLFRNIMTVIIADASKRLNGIAQVYEMDSRKPLNEDGVKYTCVITSPPYPNRVSYVRELRPYMYWTGFLENSRMAGELDWKAIGGTWGAATSRLKEWRPRLTDLPEEVYATSEAIRDTNGKNAVLMSTYVLKYFHDMHEHFANLRDLLSPGARLLYIVGNSSFYGVQVDTAHLLARSLESLGYKGIESKVIRKRNSKKELFEYRLTATWE